MSNLSSRRVRWFALLVTLVLIPTTMLLCKVHLNTDALKLFAPLPATMTSSDNPVTDTRVKVGQNPVLRSSSVGQLGKSDGVKQRNSMPCLTGREIQNKPTEAPSKTS